MKISCIIKQRIESGNYDIKIILMSCIEMQFWRFAADSIFISKTEAKQRKSVGFALWRGMSLA